jgi:hypothetical protein
MNACQLKFTTKNDLTLSHYSRIGLFWIMGVEGNKKILQSGV